MKSKKGFIFGFVGLAYIIGIIIILGLLVWFGFRISEGLNAVFSFLETWWPWIAVSISAVLFRTQILAIINFVLRKIGVKV